MKHINTIKYNNKEITNRKGPCNIWGRNNFYKVKYITEVETALCR